MQNAIATTTKSVLNLIDDYSEFRELGAKAQSDIVNKLHIVESLRNVAHGTKGAIIKSLMAKYKVTQATIYNYLKAFNSDNYRGLIDHRRFPSEAGGLPPAFKSWIKSLADPHQRADDGEEICRKIEDQLLKWRSSGDPAYAIPGYSTPPANDPRYDHPPSWSPKNLKRQLPPRYQKTLAKRGELEANKYLPQVLTTRVGSAYLSRILTDDQDYDNLLLDGTLALAGIKETQRPVSFNALDFYTAFHLSHHMRLEYKEPDRGKGKDKIKGKKKSLTSAEYQWFIINLLQKTGYRTDELGTELIGEHKTAAPWKNKDLTTIGGFNSLHEALQLATKGNVSFNASGLVNQSVFATLYFKPQSTGNFKFKTWIETAFRLLRTYMQALPGPLGSNERINGKADMYGVRQRSNKLAKAITEYLDPHSAALIKTELLDFPQFFQLVSSVYNAVNHRHDHKLEGYEQCGFTESLWRPSVDSQLWYSNHELENFKDPIDKKMILARLNANSETLTRKRYLQPSQARDLCIEKDKQHITTLKDRDVGSLLPWEWAQPATVGDGHSFSIKNQLWMDTRDTYVAQVVESSGLIQTLPHGMKLRVFSDLISAKAHCYSVNGEYIATLHPTVRAEPFNFEKTEELLKVRASVKSVMTADQRVRMSDVGAHQHEREANNDRILKGDKRTASERKSDSAYEGAKTRSDNRAEETLTEVFSDLSSRKETVIPDLEL